MKHKLTLLDPAGWYQCRDSLGRIVIRYWDQAQLKNFPEAAWAWDVSTCREFIGPLLPAGLFAAVFPVERREQARQPLWRRMLNWFRRR